jgi:hypothetical protein
MAAQRLPHILITNPPDSIPFTSTSSGGGEKYIPARDRNSHGEFLREKLREAWRNAVNEQAVAHATRPWSRTNYQES